MGGWVGEWVSGLTDLPMGSAWKSVRTRVAPSVAPVPRKSGTARVVPSRRGSKGARPKRRALIRGYTCSCEGLHVRWATNKVQMNS